MIFKHLLVLITALLFSILCFSQNQVNQMDAKGERHGLWKKTFPNSEQLRYEGNFEHGKEIGEFKFYCEKCKDQPAVVKNFTSDDDLADVKYFTPKGKLVSEGKMKGKDRIGEWVYYHKDFEEVMTREFYSNGKLDGIVTTYYPNGKITEEITYKNGLQDGPNNYYSYEGVLLKKLLNKDDKLHGPAFYYDSNGKIILEGFYKNGRKDSLWKEYEDGKLVSEESFPKKYDK